MNTFTFTVDVEPDATAGSWNTSNPITYEGIFSGIGEIQRIANEFGVSVTYFIQPVILFNDECVKVFQQLEGSFELGTHLHGEYIEPQAKYKGPDFSGCNPGEKQSDYPEELETAKMESLTDLFISKFKNRPQSFRAGRFGSSWRSLKILKKLQYTHDSSVIPRCKQFKKVKSPEPFLRNGIIEVPVTIDVNRKWLRPTPTYSSAEEMGHIICKGYSHLCSMIHNVEVIPQKSPYCSTVKECSTLKENIRRLFESVIKYQYKPCSLCEVQV